MADKDIIVWETEDDVRVSGLDRITARYLLSEQDLGLVGGVEEAYRRVQFEDGEVAAEADRHLRVLHHLVLNLMRADSGLDFTSEPNPSKWPIDELEATIVHTRKKRKRVAGTGQGQASGDQFARVDVVDREIGWGNEYIANSNPKNSDGERGTIDARPGWWYRMAFDERNRETLLRSLKPWDPNKVGRMVDGEIVFNKHRHDQLMRDPRRIRALDYLERTRELIGVADPANPTNNLLAGQNAVDPEVVEAIQSDLANKRGTQVQIAKRHGVSPQTVSKINTGKYKAASTA